MIHKELLRRLRLQATVEMDPAAARQARSSYHQALQSAYESGQLIFKDDVLKVLKLGPKAGEGVWARRVRRYQDRIRKLGGRT